MKSALTFSFKPEQVGDDRTIDNTEYGKWDSKQSSTEIQDVMQWLLDADNVPTEWSVLQRLREQHRAD